MILLISCDRDPAPTNGETVVANDPIPKDESLAAQPKKSAANPAQIAKLNKQLASRLIFAEPDEIIELIKKGATPDAKNRYGLPVIFLAAERGNLTILETLIEAGANVNSKIGTTHNTDGAGYTGTADGTPMGYAAAKGKVEAMQFLLDNKADVNGAGPEGTTPLMRASESLQLEAVQWLLENGSSAGKEKALGLTSMFVNPDEKTKKIILLLK
ncbi:MAG: ankyrin repeat domain-containing protein [Verrucomicrobiota bacterium]